MRGATVVSLVLAFAAAGWAGDEPAREVVRKDGALLRVIEPDGRARDVDQVPPTVLDRPAEGQRSLAGPKARAGVPVGGLDTWPMFQFDAKHTGFVPAILEPQTFAFRWQRSLGTYPLNPVAAGDGRVFVSKIIYFDDVPTLFALDAADGHTLWSKSFGSIFSVNPPSYAYGNVYVQTGNHGNDTYLRAYDAATGNVVFQAPHTAQWERYYAPTIDDGKVYVNGGYYGGMYSFDAHTGQQYWFAANLPQYDEWTPAVADGRAYAYVGEYAPGLYAEDAATGAPAGFIPDDDFDWNGWSMDLAPVIGAHDDLLAIHDGRLISFDTAHGEIRWQVPSQFAGQPSIAEGLVYAIDNGSLVVLDELTHAQQWSWTPPGGALEGPMIVTRTHVVASTAQATYLVDLFTHAAVWSYPVGGTLALGNSCLYIASENGTLTAISAPLTIPSQLLSLELSGPAEVPESSTAQYQAVAHYANGMALPRTGLSQWIVEPGTYAGIVGPGRLATAELIRPTHDVVLRARYTENAQTVEGTLPVRITTPLTPPQLMVRDLHGATDLKKAALADLEKALDREQATLEFMGNVPQVVRAICREEQAVDLIHQSLVDLAEIINPALNLPPLARPPARTPSGVCLTTFSDSRAPSPGSR